MAAHHKRVPPGHPPEARQAGKGLVGKLFNAPGGSTQLLTDGATSDYPFACSPGVSGSSSDVVAQNGPQCTYV